MNCWVILHCRVNHDSGFQKFRVTIEVASSNLAKPLPFSLMNKSCMECNDSTTRLIPTLNLLLLLLIKYFGELIRVIKNQNIVVIENLWNIFGSFRDINLHSDIGSKTSKPAINGCCLRMTIPTGSRKNENCTYIFWATIRLNLIFFMSLYNTLRPKKKHRQNKYFL